MSAFLGHIHYWLYNKIRLVAEREERLFQAASGLCGTTAEEIREQVWQTYGQPLPDADLSELVDHSNIHGWLQRQINISETREAAFVKELIDMCGGSAADLVEQVFFEHGQECARRAQQQGEYDLTNPEGIYKAMNDFFLNGMPCDQGAMVEESTPDFLAWSSEVCLKAPNWQRAGIEADVMRGFYTKWIKGFIETANPDFAYTAPQPGGPARHEIRKANG